MKWQVRQKIRRIAALLLSFVLLFDALEISAPAPVVRAMEESFDAFCDVTSFAELPQETREQTLPAGAKESDIILPDSLTATANVLAELPATQGAAKPDQAQTENASAGNGAENSTKSTAQSPETETESEAVIVEVGEQSPVQQSPAQSVSAKSGEAAGADGAGTDGTGEVALTIESVEEIPQVQNTVTLEGVKWSIDAKRSAADTFLTDAEHEGAVYVYVPVLPKKDSRGNTVALQVGVQLPEIRVTVGGPKDTEAGETETFTEAPSKSETETETDAPSKPETKTETETSSGTETKTGTGTPSKSETETETEKPGKSETEIETKTETETDTEIETDAETETGSDKVVEKETESETETEEITESESETESETETEIQDEIEEQEVSMMSLTGENDTIDLKPFIGKVEFTWKNDAGYSIPILPDENGEVKLPAGHTLGFKLYYHIPNGTVTADNNIITYTLPDGFNYADIHDGTIVWGKESAGSFDIVDNVLTLKFTNPDFFTSDGDFDGMVEFDSGKTLQDIGDKGTLNFSDQVKYTFTFTDEEGNEEENKDSAFDLEKVHTHSSPGGDNTFDGKNLSYRITVTPHSNGATNVTLKDWLGNIQVNYVGQSGENVEFKDIVVSDQLGKELNRLDDWKSCTEGNLEVVGPDEDGRTVTTIPYSKDGNVVYKKITTSYEDNSKPASEIIVPEKNYYIVERQDDGTYIFHLPDMAAGEQYTIDYKIDLEDALESTGYDSVWDRCSLNNFVSDSSGQNLKNVWESHVNSWISKSLQGNSVSKNEDGDYKAVWNVTINSNHQALPLDTVFSDKLSWPDGVQNVKWSNRDLSITVTDKEDNVQKFVSIPSDLLASLLPSTPEGGSMTIRDLLTKLGLALDAGAETTDYKIEINYSTTVETNTLPNGSTTANNTAQLTQGDKGGSASAGAGFQNDLLKKEALADRVEFGEAAYLKDGSEAEQQVLLIPWQVTVSMDSDLAETAATGASVNAAITDLFDKGQENHLWVTPDYLEKEDNLKIILLPDNEVLDSSKYELSYTTDGTNFLKYEDGTIDGKTRIIGFKVEFSKAAYTEIEGKQLQLNYTLFGDTDFLHEQSGTTPSHTFKNWVEYGEIGVEVDYTKQGDYFEKELFVNNSEQKNDCTIEWKQLPSGRLKWRIMTNLSNMSAGKDITITDRFPAGQLSLHSIMVERNWGSNGATNVLTGLTAPGDYKLDFADQSYTTQLDVKLEEIQGSEDILITVTIPGELTNITWFDMIVEADIPADSPLLDSTDLSATSAIFTNKASLLVDEKPSNEDDHTVTVTREKSFLEKNGIYTSSGVDKIMHYELVANPGGQRHLNNGNMLELVDTLTYEPDLVTEGRVLKEARLVNFVQGSLKAYFYKDGEPVYLPGDGYNFSYTYKESDLSQTNGNQPGKRENKLIMQIPDGLEVHIEYDYRLQSDSDFDQWHKWQIDNEVVLSGHEGEGSSDHQEVEYQHAVATVTKNFVDFYKVDADNYNITLPDAEFILYEWTPYTEDFTKDVAGQAKNETPDLYRFLDNNDEGCWKARQDAAGNVQRYVSDGKGQLPIKELTSGKVYWLKETKAPTGYNISNGDYYFYLVNNAADTQVPAGLTDVHDLSGANTVYIPNQSDGKISARKIWAEGTPKSEITLALYKGYGAGYTYKDIEKSKLQPVTDANGNPLTRTIPAGASDDELTVTWDGLLQQEGDKPIYYYVFETQAGSDGTPKILEDGSYIINGYNVEYSGNFGLKAGIVTITNSKGSITAKKVWEKDTERSDVTFKLYRSTKNDLTAEQIQQYFEQAEQDPSIVDEGADSYLEPATDSRGTELESQTILKDAPDNELTVQWSDLPVVDEDGNKLYYYVFETQAGGDGTMQFLGGKYQVDGYEVSYAGNGVTNGTVTVTNKGRNVTDIKVVKKWLDTSDKEITLDPTDESWKVTLQLYQKEGENWVEYHSGSDGTVTLPESGKWEHIWSELPKGEYYVKEVNGKEGFDPYYKKDASGELTIDPDTDKNPESASVVQGTITVINKVQTTEIEVQKVWNGREGDSVKMKLYQSTTPPAKKPETFNTSITVGVDTWLTPEGTPGSEPNRGEITVNIYECDEHGARKEGGPIRTETLRPDAWSATVNDLPGYIIDSFNQKTVYYYTVECVEGDGIESVEITSGAEVLEGDKNHTVGLTAQYKKAEPKKKTIELVVTCGWTGVSYGEIETDKAIVRIMSMEPDQAKDAFDRGISLEPENKKIQCVLLEAGKCQDTPYGYVSFMISNLQAVDDDPIKITCDATGMDVWQNNNKIEPYPASSVSYTAGPGYRLMNTPGDTGTVTGLNFPPEDDAKEVEDSVTLNSDNEWYHKWENLPQYDSDGNKLYYYVKEVETSPAVVSTNYQYKYIDEREPWKGIQKVTVTNTLPDLPKPETTTVTVEKEWAGYRDENETADYRVELQLERREKDVYEGEDGWTFYEKATLTKDTNWKAEWLDLVSKEYDSEGVPHEYEYQVKEVKVFGPPDSGTSGASPGEDVEIKNFDTTYSQSGNSWTITNTKKRQGITLPGTGSKYPWIFYGIGTTFLLIALAWMSRALKKSYIPSDTGKGGRQSDE